MDASYWAKIVALDKHVVQTKLNRCVERKK